MFDLAAVRSARAAVTTANEQGEYYLTDTIAILKVRKRIVLAFRADDAREVIGVNTVEQLAEAETAFLALRARGAEGP